VPKAAVAAVPGARVKASPLARKIATEKGINLATLTGTGPGGRIVAADVENARPIAASGPVAVAGMPAPILPRVGEKDEVLPVSNMRKIIADRLLASKLQLPHFYLRLEVDADPLMALREQVNASEAKREGGNKYTVNDFILKAVVSALQAVPAVNASWNGDSIVRYASIGLSVAISVEDGLVTPVIKQAEAKSLIEISRAVKDLAVRARDKKLKPDEFDGGTITVSNLGAWGIDHFDAIINPPQASILSVGAIKEQPVVKNGQLAIGRRMWLGLSCDHRVVDGAVAAEFLAAIAQRVEQPALMLV
jgi:pyruvate dehydrogenase E2 component (dihydrolipoamide acetyltransferase)